MYGVVARYIIKPAEYLNRSSSAPSDQFRTRSSSRQRITNFIDGYSLAQTVSSSPSAEEEEELEDEQSSGNYGSTASRSTETPQSAASSASPPPSRSSDSSDGESDSSSSTQKRVAVPRQQHSKPGLKRSLSELPVSSVTVFSYQDPRAEASPGKTSATHKQRPSIDDDNENEPQPRISFASNNAGFLSAAPSNNTLPMLLTATCCIGSLLFGFHIAFSSPFEQDLLKTVQIAKGDADLMFSLISVGAIFGALASGPIASSLGRKPAILLSVLPYIVGAFMMAAAVKMPNFAYSLLAAGRLTVGAAVGASSVLVPLYVAEIAPPDLRGSLGACCSFFMTAGLVVVNALGIGAVHMEGFWQYAMLGSCIPAILMALIMLVFGVETPRYLMSVDREEEAKKALRKLRGPDWNVDGELNDLENFDEFGMGSVSESKEALRRWKETYMQYFESEQSDKGDADADVTDEEQEVAADATPRASEGRSSRMSALAEDAQEEEEEHEARDKPSVTEVGHHKHHSPTSKTAAPLPSVLVNGAVSKEMILPEAPADIAQMKHVHIDIKNTRHHLKFAAPDTMSTPLLGSDHHEQLHGNKKSNKPFVKPDFARARSIARKNFPIHAMSSSTKPYEESDGATGFRVYLKRQYLIPLLLGITLQLIQQASGINAVVFHMKDILSSGGSVEGAGANTTSAIPSPSPYEVSRLSGPSPNTIDDNQAQLLRDAALLALYGAICVNGLQLAVGGFGLVFMERAGRRFWFLLSLFGMASGAFLLAWAYLASLDNIVKIAALMLYMASFALGVGPMPWLVVSEITPSAISSTAVSLATTANWLGAFLVTASYPMMEAAITASGVYIFYGVLLLVSAVFVFFALPETRGKSFEEIEGLFAS